jgi:hypothetical protein
MQNTRNALCRAGHCPEKLQQSQRPLLIPDEQGHNLINQIFLRILRTMPSTLAATSPAAKDLAPTMVDWTDKTDWQSLLHNDGFNAAGTWLQSAWSSNNLLVSAWEQRSTSLLRHSAAGATQLRNKKLLNSAGGRTDRLKDMVTQSQH